MEFPHFLLFVLNHKAIRWDPENPQAQSSPLNIHSAQRWVNKTVSKRGHGTPSPGEVGGSLLLYSIYPSEPSTYSEAWR